MTAEFFKNFDQNTVGKLQWQTYQMTLKIFENFDQNSGSKSSCSNQMKAEFLWNFD